MQNHPIFGRADENDALAEMIETRLEALCEAFREGVLKLENEVLAAAKSDDPQVAEDWVGDLAAATDPIFLAIVRLEAQLRRAAAQRRVRPVMEAC